MLSISQTAVPGSPPLKVTALRLPFRRKRLAPPDNGQPAPVTQGQLDYADVGPMKIGHFTTDRRCVVQHPLNLASQSPSYVAIKLQLAGQSVVEQFGRVMVLTPGSWGLCDAPKPCVSRHSAGVSQLHLLVPRELVRLGVDVRFAMGRAFGSDAPVSALLCQTVRSLYEQLPQLDPRRAEELAEVGGRLFHLAVLEQIERPCAQSLLAQTRDRICQYVENQLRDPCLTLDRVATEMNCTKRYLHMVFAGEPHTLSEHIWIRRLERCRLDLVNPAHAEQSITAIAVGWGFSNLSHFSRAFREQYGVTPRAIRTAAAPCRG